MNVENKKQLTFKNIHYPLVFLCYALLALLITYPLVLDSKNCIYGFFYTTDLRGSAWNWWWTKFSFAHHLNFNDCSFIGAPDGVNLGGQIYFWISSSFSNLLAITIGFPAGFNLLVLLGFALSGLFVYLLSYELFKNRLAAYFAGFIYTFSPYHLNKIMEFGFAFHGCWIAFYIFRLIKLFKERSLKNICLAGFALALVIDFNIYYGFFSILTTIGLMLFCIFYRWRDKLCLIKDKIGLQEIKRRVTEAMTFVGNLLAVGFTTLLICFPFVITLIKSILTPKGVSAQAAISEYVRSLDYLFAQSARPLSYLLPASTHPIFGGFTKKMFGSIFYGRGSIEQTLYLGWVPLILAYFAFRQWRHKRSHPGQYPDYQANRENFYIGFFIFSAIFAFFCSLPPYVDLGLFKIYLPSYFFYKVLPMFRAYARFGILVSLSVSVLAGFGLRNILERIKNKKRQGFFTGAVCLVILFEFMNVPPFRVTDISGVPGVYQWLKEQKGDIIVAEYPMSMVSSGEAWENYDYLYNQTFHQKRLVNGAIAGSKAFEIKKRILKINEPETINILKKLGVKYVILHNDLFKKGDYKDAVDVVGEVPKLDNIAGWNLIKTFDTVSVYDIGGEPQKEKSDAS